MFFLCDPGLLLPPNAPDLHEHERFWRRLVEWASDKRVALGPETHDLIIEYFELHGWPNYQPPRCPQGLSNLARSALHRLLATKREPASPPVNAVELDPKYVRHEDGELAIAIDITSQWDKAPVALASAEAHWDPPSSLVKIIPPPPETIGIVTEPNAVTEHDELELLRRRMSSRRVTVVGGVRDPDTCHQIETYFDLDSSDIRWIESRLGSQPQTERLKGMRGHSDVLCCVLGCEGVAGLGHSGTAAAVEVAHNRGVPHCKVERPPQIIEAIVALLGRKQ